MSTNNTYVNVSMVKKTSKTNKKLINLNSVSVNSSNKEELNTSKKGSLLNKYTNENENFLKIGEDKSNSSEASFELEFEDVRFSA